MTHSRFDRALRELEEDGVTKLRGIGNSMTPKISNGALLTIERSDDYEVGDAVLCKVRGCWYEAHLVLAKSEKRGFKIGNNHGHVNGWTKKVFGKVVKIEPRKRN